MRSPFASEKAIAKRPALLPVWGYGFTYVCNQNIDQYNLVNEALQFRDRDLPCDVIGLEPGWMQTFYDASVYKEWNQARFYFPYWAPKGDHTFVGALRRIGFKLSLWLCCDYDIPRLGDAGGHLYALVYDKQMARGFEDYTGKRAMVYSAGGYAGVQRPPARDRRRCGRPPTSR